MYVNKVCYNLKTLRKEKKRKSRNVQMNKSFVEKSGLLKRKT